MSPGTAVAESAIIAFILGKYQKCTEVNVEGRKYNSGCKAQWVIHTDVVTCNSCVCLSHAPARLPCVHCRATS